ncbi:MAG TPA: hypothetical protein VFM54_13125 [Micromonosporaceae bacterium]|nr:hypothetical protein [Micromonosporaceae bacterium]
MAGEVAQVGLGDCLLSLDLGDPLLDDGGVGAGLQGGAVPVELGLAGG